MEVILEESSYKKYHDTSSNIKAIGVQIRQWIPKMNVCRKKGHSILGLESEYFFNHKMIYVSFLPHQNKGLKSQKKLIGIEELDIENISTYINLSVKI